MSERHCRRVPVLLITPAVAAVALGLAACGSSPSHPSGAPAATSPRAARSAGVAAETVTFTGTKLRGALLTKINGVSPAVAATEGTYSSLPRMAQEKSAGIAVDPKACANRSMAGLSASEVKNASAASVTFKVGGNGVSEVLVSPSADVAASVLAQKVPAECASYKATVGGKTYHYAVKDSSIRGIGEQARAVNVQTIGYPSDNVWTVVFRGTGFVGAVTIVGPDASEVAARELTVQAYDYAAKALS